jgi:hypothetical protein
MVADSDCSKRWLPFGALLEATKKSRWNTILKEREREIEKILYFYVFITIQRDHIISDFKK